MLMAVVLLPWASLQIQAALRDDVTWLVEAASRLLNGGSYITDVLEINLPLSIVLYMPLALAVEAVPSSLPYAFFIYTVAATVLSACLSNVVIKRYQFLDAPERLIFLTGFILSSTVLLQWVEFGQREQFIFMGILPLILLQLGATFKTDVNPGLEFWPIVILGGLAMLIKPHYGLPFAIIMLVRMVHQRRLFVLFDKDFLGLAAITLSYIGTICFFFPDYFFDYLPDVANLYALTGGWGNIARMGMFYLVFLTAIVLISFLVPIDRRLKSMLLVMIAFSAICLVPYVVQMKGFPYHLLPAKGFAFCAVALLISGVGQFLFKTRKSVWGIYLFLAVLAYTLQPLNPRFPSHHDFASLPLTQKVKDCGQADCSFFMYVHNFNINYTTAYYTGQRHTSRFCDTWPLIGLSLEHRKLAAGKSDFTREELDQYLDRYVKMFVDDIRRWKPEQLFICRDCAEDPFLDFLSLMARAPSFVDEWKQYREIETIVVNRTDYYAGLSKKNEPVERTFTRYARIHP